MNVFVAKTENYQHVISSSFYHVSVPIFMNLRKLSTDQRKKRFPDIQNGFQVDVSRMTASIDF